VINWEKRSEESLKSDEKCKRRFDECFCLVHSGNSRR
jgi:hypothetical protein